MSATRSLGGIYLGCNLRCRSPAISEAGASDEPVLCNRGDFFSTFPGFSLQRLTVCLGIHSKFLQFSRLADLQFSNDGLAFFCFYIANWFIFWMSS